jgi:hypothetical protein
MSSPGTSGRSSFRGSSSPSRDRTAGSRRCGASTSRSHGLIHDIAQFLPSYWLVQASHVALGGHSWPAMAWLVMAGWTVLLSGLAVRAYRRDTGRV